jgi:hypothetical protein
LIKSPLIPINNVIEMSEALKSFCEHPIARTFYDLRQYRIESKLAEIETFYKSLNA